MTAGERGDVLVVGGGVAGLFVAHTLATWGFETRLVEKSAHVGSWDRSFANARGTLFDLGVHSLAYRRSDLVTRLFTRLLRGRVRRFDVKRAIVLRNHLIPYNVPAAEWPPELRALLPAGEILDDLGDAPRSRENLARIYGAAFADLVFDEVLASYPAEAHHLGFGVPEEKLLTNIYPWFFPAAERVSERGSGRFQHRVRSGEVHEQALYPEEGGFGAFPEALARELRELGVDVVTGADDLAFDIDPQTHRVRSVTARGARYEAWRVYWCASPAELHRALGWPVPDLTPDFFALGSFEFERPVATDFTEVIVADPDHFMDRISFRGLFAGSENRQVQVEFAFPRAATGFDSKESFWLEHWQRSLRRLGVVQAENPLLDFDLKLVPILYNTWGVDGKPRPKLAFDLHPETNLRPVLPTVDKINLNTRIPDYLRYLASDLG